MNTASNPTPTTIELNLPNAATNQINTVQTFAPLPMPSNNLPWKCPDWMTTQNIQPGAYMNFNGQQQIHLPVKRRAPADIDP